MRELVEGLKGQMCLKYCAVQEDLNLDTFGLWLSQMPMRLIT